MTTRRPDDELSTVDGTEFDMASIDASEGRGSASDDFLRRVAGAHPGRAEDFARDAPRTERFEIRRRLGRGGFGTVYEAFDRERGALVALKTMNSGDPRSIYRFKQEFRKLSELSHPHLVQLYELHSDGKEWFFTMELVRGRDAHAYVQAAAPEPDAGPVGVLPQATFDEAKVRALYRQLVEGVSYLHDAGRLHRDIKPANVVVADAGEAWPDGRAVLLDFGLVTDVEGTDGEASLGAFAGTPSYMAPEQATGSKIGPAADWYAVGTMLYHALAGRLPFEGGPDLLRQKRDRDPPPPSDHVAGVPADLNQLCMDLLSRSPSRRPSGRELLARLPRGGGGDGPGDFSAPPSTATGAPALPPFFGRVDHRRRLHDAFQSVRAGQCAVALVHGASGMGKSALVARFLAEMRAAEPNLMLLAGRCFEQESVPFKALDSVVDALSRQLQRMARAEVVAILPRDIAALSRLFPVLRQVHAVEDAPQRGEGAGKLELRRRAFFALRELFARLGDRRTLVVFIDDLQWGDADSAALLAHILAPPDAPAMLLVAAYRSEETERSECLRAFLPPLAPTAPIFKARVLDVEVARLDDEEARELALATLMDCGATGDGPARAAEIARESGGWPFFIRELVRFSDGSPGTAGHGEEALTLERMLAGRVAALPEEARRLLAVIAVAGQPIERRVAAAVAALSEDEPSVLGLLRREHLVRAGGGRGRDEIEPYHDRIRETVIGGLAAEAKRDLHARLAPTLEATGRADAETLAAHFQGAGELARAADYLIQAADQALEALGFDRAARRCHEALGLLDRLDLTGPADPRRQRVWEKLGDALASSGRSAEGAAAYLSAVDGASALRASELRRRAAEHYLISGHLEEGREVLRDVLAATGLSMPRSPFRSVLRHLPLLVLLWWRGLQFRERPAAEIPAEVLLRIDACAAASTGLVVADPLPAAYFQRLFLLLALRAGEPNRVLRALIFEGALLALRGHAAPSRLEERLDAAAGALAQRIGDPGVRLQIGRGVVLALRCRFREARVELEAAEARTAELGAGVMNEPSICRFQLIQALFVLGEWKELVRRRVVFVDDAQARGDRLLEARLSMWGHIAALMADRPEEAREALERAESLWSRGDLFQHFGRLTALGVTWLYLEAGIGDGALRFVLDRWPALVDSGLMTFSSGVRGHCFNLRGGASLAAAAAATGSRRATLLRAVDRDARRLARLPTWTPLGLFLAAGAAALRAEPERAARLLLAGEADAAAHDLALYAASARRRRGELLGGEEGQRLMELADAVMSAQGIRNPARLAAMLIPGRYGPVPVARLT